MLGKKEGIASQSAKLRMLLAVVALTAMLALALTACAPGGSKSDSAGDGGVDWDAIIAENPDDPFVASYSSGDDDHLVTMHQKLGYTCADCHDDADAQRGEHVGGAESEGEQPRGEGVAPEGV